MKKTVVVLIILLSLGFVAYKIFFSPKTIYQEAAVSKKDLEIYVSASGRMRAVAEQSASFPILGQVEMIATSGAVFKKGDIVARLKTSELYADLQAAYAALNKARSNFYYYLEAKSQADSNYGWKEDAVSKSLVKQANNNVAIAQDGVQSAEFSLDGAKADYNKAFIRAPFDGTVGQTSAKVGETVTAGETVAVLVDPSSYYFEAEVDEVDVRAARPGQGAKITLDSFPNTEFDGRVGAGDLTSHTTSSGGTAYFVKVLFTNLPQPSSLRPGLNGEARLSSQVLKDALTVPAPFVTQAEGKDYVLVKSSSGSPVRRPVEIGELVDGQYEIKKGLEPGEIVLAPVKK